MADLTAMMQAAAGAAGEESLFIEDVFSCFLYTGNGGTQTITNGIDLAGEGGLVWLKTRSTVDTHQLYDTNRGVGKRLASNGTSGQEDYTTALTNFNSDGFSLGAGFGANTNNVTYASWTFRKAPKFFDVVTYTGTGANRTVAHNLGSVPGSIWVKRTDDLAASNWQVYHRANTANPETDFLVLNSTAQTIDSNTRWNDTLPTDTVFTVGTEATVNASGGTYVAYLFAHDDGGFGDDGTENVITCGSYTGTGATGNFITLGYEPQWVMTKRTNGEGNWNIEDIMRGFPVSGNSQELLANSAAAEQAVGSINVTSTGFQLTSASGDYNGSGNTYIFIAIRRGPMKTPTAGTEVFAPAVTGSNNTPAFSTSFPPDLCFAGSQTGTDKWYWADRLRGSVRLNSATASAESGVSQGYEMFQNGSFSSGWVSYRGWNFRRAPGYFDVVAYTGTGTVGQTYNHNLGVVPDLMIIKRRNASYAWAVYVGALGNNKHLILNETGPTEGGKWNNTTPTSTVFTLSGVDEMINVNGGLFVNYLFASLAGVQDIGTYTGNGTSLTVTTGFQPRFIMVRRTNSGGAARNWIVGDSARGLVAGDDPALFFNSSAAETTGQDWVDVSATGFTVNETALNANVSTGVYLYWAIS